MNRKDAERQGRRGEGWAALYLRLLGWRILDRRVKTPRGEIDLIAKRGSTIAFIEVKWRKSGRALDYALDEYRLGRVAAAVNSSAHRYAKRGENIRVDALLLAPWRWPRHMTNVWQP